jgi:GTP pyrophosphokinase
VYRELVDKIALKKEEREQIIADIVSEVSEHLQKADINAVMMGRVKHFFSIYKKMVKQDKTVDQIYDLFAVRILVESVKDCYAALGVIHELYKPIPGRFKDYIAMPKPNMYQSLHTTLIGRDGTPFEIQIRTFEMHRVAEFGIAAHWKYKESGGSTQKADSVDDEKMAWLRQVLEWQKDTEDGKEFLNLVKSDFDLFNENVYCFTPTGDVKSLPMGSTPIDFAYSIHSAVGNKMVGARVNEKLVPIDYKLRNGDRVEIITSQNSRGPSRDWLNMVKSSQARNKINQWFKEQNKEDNIDKGRDLLERSSKAKGYVPSELLRPEYMEKVMKKYGFQEWNAVLASIGHGGIKEGQVINRLAEERRKDRQSHITDAQVIELVQEQGRKAVAHSKGGIVVEGINDLAVHFSRCCSPIPGDEIVGFVTRGRGISIHRTDCVNVMNLPAEERDRLIEAEWQLPEESSRERYLANMIIYVNNRVGMLADISRVMTEMNIDIVSLNTKVNKQGIATVELSFQSTGTAEINTVTAKLKQISGVFDVTRM